MLDIFIDNISDKYASSSNVTFDTWFLRYEYTFIVDFGDQNDYGKLRIILRKLGAAALGKYNNILLPRNSRESFFAETITLFCHLLVTNVRLSIVVFGV